MQAKTKGGRNWSEIFEQWSQSGLTIAEFCKVNGVAPSSFYKAKKQMKRLKPKIEQGSSKFLDVTPTLPLEHGEPATIANPALRIRTNNGCIVEVFA